MAKYNIGFITKHPKKDEYIASCNCGTVNLLGSLGWRELEGITKTTTCKGCKNKNFIKLTQRKRDIFPYIEVLRKDRKGFKVKRTNLSVFYDDDYNVLTKENMVQVLKFDLLDKKIKLYKNGERTKFLDDDILNRFFYGIECYDFKNMVSVAETETLYNFMWSKISYPLHGYKDRKFWRAMRRYITENYDYIQILANAGFPNVERFYVRTERYYNETDVINPHGKSPKDILGVPKFVLKYIRENQNIMIYELRQIKNALKKVDGNRFKELLEIVKDESTIRELCNTLDTLIEIHDKYNYNNIKKLTLYLFREIRMTQGIDSPQHGAGLLRDYIRMSTKLEQEYEKYPKSLKKEHDITQMNYKVQESEIKRKEFIATVESEDYKRLEFKKKDFSIITPKEMDDLIKEGSELSHCVASYVDSIIKKQCNILFLRDTSNLDLPLATVEVRGGNIRQARGFANRALKQSERDFVAEWAKKKDLEINYYY